VTVAKSDVMIDVNDRFYSVFAHAVCRIIVTVTKSNAMIDVND